MWQTARYRPVSNWSETIRNHRVNVKHMTQREYAEWLDVGRMSILRWEAGLFAPCRVSRALLRAKGVV
jgi:DNA-binding transcriptional regulator YiaG